jgi:hypothetical protein
MTTAFGAEAPVFQIATCALEGIVYKKLQTAHLLGRRMVVSTKYDSSVSQTASHD